MRVAFLTDIHGNLPALKAVLDDVRGQEVDAIATVGDLTSGVWAEEVVAQALDLARWSIAGNHEGYYLAYDRGTAPEEWYRDQNWGCMRWCYQRLSRPTLNVLGELPEQTVIRIDDFDPIRLLHGSPQSSLDRLYPTGNHEAMAHFERAGFLRHGPVPTLNEALADIPEPVVVCGHTHIPWVQRASNKLVVNAGAVGGALNSDWRAQYAILTWTGISNGWRAEHRAVPYDLDRLRKGFSHSGYLAEGGAFARALLLNAETGENWPGTLLRHVYGQARKCGWDGEGLLCDDMWNAGVATFNWDRAL